jgi:hypothetical protein
MSPVQIPDHHQDFAVQYPLAPQVEALAEMADIGVRAAVAVAAAAVIEV